MVKIKVCGIRDKEGAIACEQNQVDFVGFNFVIGRRRAISIQQAIALQPFCPTPQSVGVFFNQSVEVITNVLDEFPLDFVQLHGSESIQLCQQVSQRAKIIKAFSIDKNFDESALHPYQDYVSFWLFDAPSAGEGKRFDWTLIQDLKTKTPYWLAGGLNPENVVEAIQKFSPYAVDTASGVEVKGEQCPQRIATLCQAVRDTNETRR